MRRLISHFSSIIYKKVRATWMVSGEGPAISYLDNMTLSKIVCAKVDYA